MTSEGKLCVCNDVCENMAKFHIIKKTKSYIDCLKFYQSTLSSGQSIGLHNTEILSFKIAIKHLKQKNLLENQLGSRIEIKFVANRTK